MTSQAIPYDERAADKPGPLVLGNGAVVMGGLGFILAFLVLSPVHLACLLANALAVHWLSRRSWNWIRKYSTFFLIQSLYFCALFSAPKPGYELSLLFGQIIPAGPYFQFLWTAAEVVAALKLIDFAFCRNDDRNPAEFSLPRLFFFLLYPFTFLAGPVTGYEEFYNGYRPRWPALADVVYSARKLAWGGVQLFVLSPWLQASLLALRESVQTASGSAATVDPRLMMWLWIAGMSVLLYIVYKGYTDLMLGLCRIAGLRLPEQFWFTLFAKDPSEYWQNGNRGVYRITTQYIFVRMFDRRRLSAKAMASTAASGVAHSLMCPAITFPGGVLLGLLFGTSGLAIAIMLKLRTTRIAGLLEGAREGTAHNALVIAGVALTFALMCFPRAGFLLMVEGLSPEHWFDLMKLLFIRT